MRFVLWNVNNLTSTMTWNGAFQPTGATNPNGASTSMAYDAYARPAATTSPYGATTTTGYSTSPPTKTVTTNGRWTKTTMDGLGRPVKVETGNGTTTRSSSETKYAPCACSPNRSASWPLATALVLYPPVYYLTQDFPRYRYPILWISFLLSGYAVTHMGELYLRAGQRTQAIGSLRRTR